MQTRRRGTQKVKERGRDVGNEVVLFSHLSDLLYGGVGELHDLVHNCWLVLDTGKEVEKGREETEGEGRNEKEKKRVRE
jgi:hypothetical protein